MSVPSPKKDFIVAKLKDVNLSDFKDFKGKINRSQLAKYLYQFAPDSSIEAIRKILNMHFLEYGEPVFLPSSNIPSSISQVSGLIITDPREIEIVETYREGVDALKEECNKAKIDYNDVAHWWYKTKKASIFIKQKKFDLVSLKNELVDELKQYSPKYTLIKRSKSKSACCLVVDIADLHIGKYATDYETRDKYDMKIAVDRAKEGLKGILQYANGFQIDKIIFIIGNDILHTDNKSRQTTKGTPQDTDGMWYESFNNAKNLYVDCIEILMQVADVHVMHNMSNHDSISGWFLAQTVEAWFRHSKNVTFDITTQHRKGYRYHNSLIATTHGDGAKEKDLGLLIANDFRKIWSDIKWVYIYKGDIHHKTVKDYSGVTVTTTRSASGTDSWHDKKGYSHNKKAIEGYLHDKEKGQIAAFTYPFF